MVWIPSIKKINILSNTNNNKKLWPWVGFPKFSQYLTCSSKLKHPPNEATGQLKTLTQFIRIISHHIPKSDLFSLDNFEIVVAVLSFHLNTGKIPLLGMWRNMPNKFRLFGEKFCMNKKITNNRFA